MIDETSDVQSILLQEIAGERWLEIGIGVHEALALQRQLENQVHFPVRSPTIL